VTQQSQGRFVFPVDFVFFPCASPLFSGTPRLYYPAIMNIDADERTRLAQLYSGMTDEQVQQIAADSAALTDVAQSALSMELNRRHLAIDPPRVGKQGEESEYRNLIIIRRFRDLPEALLAKGGLESAGIECFLADDNMVRMDWFISNFIGGVKLQVKPEDAAAAADILDQPILEDFRVEGEEDYHQPMCPACESRDVSFKELIKPLAYASAYIGLPLPLHWPAWRCHACGQEWEEAGADAGEQE
jgi:hypothetical protein